MAGLDRETIIKAIRVAHSQGQTAVVEELAASLPPEQPQQTSAAKLMAENSAPLTAPPEAAGQGISGVIGRMRGHTTDAIEGVANAFDPQPVDTSNIRPDIAAAFGDKAAPSPLEGVRTGLAASIRGAAGVASEAVPEPIKRAIGSAAQTVAELPGVEQAIGAYQRGKKEYPDYFKAFEDSATIATGVFNPKARLTTRTGLGNDIIKRNKPALYDSRVKKAQDALRPEGYKGPGDWEINPKTGKKEYISTTWEQEVAEEAAKVKEFNPKKSFTENASALRNAGIEDARKLIDDINKRGNPKVDKAALSAKLDDIAENIQDMEGGFSLTGNSAAQAKKFVQWVNMELGKTKGTAVDVLALRKALDKKIRKESPKAFDPDYANASSIATKFVRDQLNESVDKAMGSFSVKNRLAKESRLFSAAEQLGIKARKDAETRVGRFFSKLQESLPYGERLPTTPLAQAATVGFGASILAGSPIIATGIAGLATLVAGYKGAKWLASAEGRTWTGKVIRAIEKDPLLSQKFKADRVALIELLNYKEPEEDQ